MESTSTMNGTLCMSLINDVFCTFPTRAQLLEGLNFYTVAKPQCHALNRCSTKFIRNMFKFEL